VGEVCAYLQKQPNYSEVLAGIEPEKIHRGQLEAVLRRGVFTQYSGLVKFDFNGGIGFYRYIIIRREVDQIITMLRLLSSGSPESYILLLPGYLNRYTEFDLDALGHVRDFDGLLQVLRRTPYYDILKNRRPAEGSSEINLAGCEQALQSYYYKTVLGLIDEHFSGAVRSQLREMVLTQVDVRNITYVYRLKRFFGAQQDEIRATLLPFDTPSRRVIERMTAAETPEELAEALAGCRYNSTGAVTTSSQPGYIEALTDRGEYDLAMRNIRFSTSPAVVLVSYMTHLLQEFENITNAIEGIRYGLPREEIRRMLIL